MKWETFWRCIWGALAVFAAFLIGWSYYTATH